MLALLAAATDLVEQIPGDSVWVPLGVGGFMLAAAVRFVLDRRRDTSQDAGWQTIVNAANQRARDAEEEARKLRQELDESRRTLADNSSQLREALMRVRELELDQRRRP